MERCPVCRARFQGETVCHRCGSDLAPLLAIETASETLEREAVAHMVAGDGDRALRVAQRALVLRRTSMAEALMGLLVARKGNGEAEKVI